MKKLKPSSRYTIKIAKVRINQYILIIINILFVLISYKENQTCCDTKILVFDKHDDSIVCIDEY